LTSPVVSFVVPARNEERYLPRALRSAQRQTVRDLEILVVDDGSTDRTPSIVRALAADDPRIRLLPNPGSGFVAAQNAGLAAARAPLVARLDADDISRPARVERQLREFDRNRRLVALGTFGLRINEWGLPVGRLRSGPVGPEGYRRVLANNSAIHLTHSSVTFRRDVAEQLGGYDADYYPADDHRLWSCMADRGEVYALPDLLTLYRLRSTSMSALQAEWMTQQATRARLWLQQGDAGSRSDDDEIVRQSVARVASRRRLARALVNGRLPTAVRVVRTEGLGLAEIRRTLSRALRG
jgi:glycosyltransferase involved in cell wall biosynthesis